MTSCAASLGVCMHYFQGQRFKIGGNHLKHKLNTLFDLQSPFFKHAHQQFNLNGFT
jgi:hypothetical protein